MAESSINGLRTPALTEGEYFDALAESPDKPAERSSLDVAAGIEQKIKALVEQWEKDDNEIETKLGVLGGKLNALRERLSTL